MYKVLILTEKKTLGWKSLKAKMKEMGRALGNDFELSIMEAELTPEVKDGRITHEWMNKISYPLYREGYQIVMVHGSLAQKKKWKIKNSLRGSAQNDKDFVGEAYFFADENTLRGKYNQFIETGLHELSHVIARGTGVNDNTHGWHLRNKTIVDIFKTYNMLNFQPVEKGYKDKIAMLTKLRDSLLAKLKGDPKELTPLVKRLSVAVVAEMKALGHSVMVYEGYRSPVTQDKYYAQGRTTPGTIITNAKGGESFHNYGVAVDIVFHKKGVPSWDNTHDWSLLGTVGKKYGFEWGGDWKGFTDRPHFELKLGYTLEDFKNGKVDYRKYG
jgi:peptidoglycan L-alanyl-D-glutamate endopeptidase CwlK